MAGNLEIERKFLVKRLPTAWKRKRSSHIVQGYFPIAGNKVEIRLRQKGAQHFITVKGGHGRRRLEEEIEIPLSKFLALWPLTRRARIAKRRYEIPFSDHTIEMDFYEGRHRGLITVEVEFDSLRASHAFEPPDWFGREITGERKYSNEKLARSQGLPRGIRQH